MVRAFRVLAIAATVVGISQPSSAATIVLSGDWSNWSVTIPFTLPSSGIVDFQTSAGSTDPVLSLFDADGNHIVTVDDEHGPPPNFFLDLQAHLTRDLVAGDYFVVLTEFPVVLSSLTGATNATTDGYNTGSYWFGGSTKLADAVAGAAATGAEFYPGDETRPYHLTITTDFQPEPVPEPTTMLLVGSGLAMAAMRRRRTRR